MAEDVIIRAEGLGKKYVIGHQSAERSTTLRDALVRAGRNFVRTTGDMLKGRALIAGDEVEEFWALKDVNFEIKRGDVVGIIGRNGAGKSTLLKVLSRITEPSEGRVEIKGRVASLLEVGTGFHPELTGRENIYLNGAILGMTREEIKRKFDEIVDFAGVEKFLDTPVKRYSSGMYVRLAFAVAAHLEPEILIVDEVLAVGDAEFQKKCLGKMKDVAGHGRTVLFVSHNMAAVSALCPLGLCLLAGTLADFGPLNQVLETRRTQNHQAMTTDRSKRSAYPKTGAVQLAINASPTETGSNTIWSELKLRFTAILSAESPLKCRPWVLVRNALDIEVLMIMPPPGEWFIVNNGEELELLFTNVLTPGVYSVSYGAIDQDGNIAEWVEDGYSLIVDGSFSSGPPFDGRLGLTTIPGAWRMGR